MLESFARLPGARIVSAIQFRPFTGSACIWRGSTFPPVEDAVVSTSGAKPVTVTDSWIEESVSLRLSTAFCPTSNCTLR